MILITGTTGFVGRRLAEQYPDAVCAPSMRGMTQDDVLRMVEKSDCDTILHTAAISDIGACKDDPDASYYANVLLPVYLAKASRGRKLVCFSSDQVYSGCDEEGPYSEETVKPANIYAEHKIEMEKRVLEIVPDAVLLRAEWMYDYVSYKSNYFKNILAAEGRVFFGSRNFRGVTYLREVAENMDAVIKMPGGAYNFGSETQSSMLDITRGFVALLGKKLEVCDGPAGHNLWMNCAKARKYGVDFSTVEEGLKRCAQDYGLIGQERKSR